MSPVQRVLLFWVVVVIIAFITDLLGWHSVYVRMPLIAVMILGISFAAKPSKKKDKTP